MTIVVTGLANGLLLFLVASGLTLILGTMRIVNFAHGGFFVFGAYLGYEIQQGHSHSGVTFVGIVLAAALATGLIGVVCERLVFRRIYTVTPLSSLLATYAMLLVLEGGVQLTWGVDAKSQSEPADLVHAVTLAGATVPSYDFLLLGMGLVVVIALAWITTRTDFGRRLAAVAEDRTMAELLGINVRRVFAQAFFLGIVLAGLGGALVGPTLSMVPDLALSFIIQVFAVVIVGGLGSVAGALVAALLLGLLHSVVANYAPSLADFTLYFLMGAVLLVRPRGLLGREGLEL